MKLQIIQKSENIPDFDPQAIKIQHIWFFDASHKKYTGAEITQSVIGEVLRKIPSGLNIYLSLDPDCEEDWLEVNSGGGWLSLGYSSDCGQDNYYSYNPAFADTADQIMGAGFSDKSIYSPLVSGGQSPIPKIQTIQDMEAGVKAVEYFIRTGELYPGIDWLHNC